MSRHPQFPLLTLIDAVRSPNALPFATDPEAVALERRARQLTDEYWPEHAFLTGNLSQTFVDAVANPLEAERLALHLGMRVFVATEQTSTPRA